MLIIEDLQHLHLSAVETLVQVLDCLLASDKAVIVTANAGPRQLQHRDERFPARLTSRLAAGLVLALEPLGTESRLALLQAQAQWGQLAVPTEALRRSWPTISVQAANSKVPLSSWKRWRKSSMARSLWQWSSRPFRTKLLSAA